MGIVEILTFGPDYNTGLGIATAIIGVAAFVCYLYEIHKHYGWLQSISISYYKDREIFQMFMYLSAFCILCIGQNVMYGLVALCFTIMAMFPSVLYKHFIIPHCIFATTAIVLGLIGLPICFDTFTGVSLDLIAVFGICALLYSKYKIKDPFISETLTYWIEVESLSIIIIGLLFNIIDIIC